MKDYFKILGWALILMSFLSIQLIAIPTLISAKSTELVLFGMLLQIMLLSLMGFLIYKQLNEKNEDN